MSCLPPKCFQSLASQLVLVEHIHNSNLTLFKRTTPRPSHLFLSASVTVPSCILQSGWWVYFCQDYFCLGLFWFLWLMLSCGIHRVCLQLISGSSGGGGGGANVRRYVTLQAWRGIHPSTEINSQWTGECVLSPPAGLQRTPHCIVG